MIIVYQRVSRASVSIGGKKTAAIGQGAVLLLAVEKGDSRKILAWGAKKTAGIRAFEDDEQKMNRSLLDVGGEALVVSQFTLAGDTRKGRRPSFVKAERPEKAVEGYEFFCKELEEQGVPVKTGEFGAMMDVELVNSGPVTLLIQRREDESS